MTYKWSNFSYGNSNQGINNGAYYNQPQQNNANVNQFDSNYSFGSYGGAANQGLGNNYNNQYGNSQYGGNSVGFNSNQFQSSFPSEQYGNTNSNPYGGNVQPSQGFFNPSAYSFSNPALSSQNQSFNNNYMPQSPVVGSSNNFFGAYNQDQQQAFNNQDNQTQGSSFKNIFASSTNNTVESEKDNFNHHPNRIDFSSLFAPSGVLMNKEGEENMKVRKANRNTANNSYEQEQLKPMRNTKYVNRGYNSVSRNRRTSMSDRDEYAGRGREEYKGRRSLGYSAPRNNELRSSSSRSYSSRPTNTTRSFSGRQSYNSSMGSYNSNAGYSSNSRGSRGSTGFRRPDTSYGNNRDRAPSRLSSPNSSYGNNSSYRRRVRY